MPLLINSSFRVVPPRGGTPDWGPYESHSCSLGEGVSFVGINSSVLSRFAHDVGGEVRLPTIFVRSFWGSGKGLSFVAMEVFPRNQAYKDSWPPCY